MLIDSCLSPPSDECTACCATLRRVTQHEGAGALRAFFLIGMPAFYFADKYSSSQAL